VIGFVGLRPTRPREIAASPSTISFMRRLDKDEILSRLGLETKPSIGETVSSVIGLFGAGVLVGAGVALLLAPKSGRELREDLRKTLGGEDLWEGGAGSDPGAVQRGSKPAT
jgi:hypothetical protein